MTYQPLAAVRKTLHVKWYRSKIDRTALRKLSKRSDVQGWFQAGGHLALWLLTGSVVCFFWSQAMWLGFCIALFVHGTVASFFKGTANHELGHGTVFRTKWLNKSFLYLLSLISWWDHFDYASSHLSSPLHLIPRRGSRKPLEPKLGSLFVLQLLLSIYSRNPVALLAKGVLLLRLHLWQRRTARNPKWNGWHRYIPTNPKNIEWWSRMLLHFTAHCLSFLSLQVIGFFRSSSLPARCKLGILRRFSASTLWLKRK